jgi:hypothetical protein
LLLSYSLFYSFFTLTLTSFTKEYRFNISQSFFDICKV